MEGALEQLAAGWKALLVARSLTAAAAGGAGAAWEAACRHIDVLSESKSQKQGPGWCNDPVNHADDCVYWQ